MRQLINISLHYSNSFSSKASIEDIIFLLYCIIFPYFTPIPIYSIIFFSILGLAHVNKVSKSISPYEFRKAICR